MIKGTFQLGGDIINVIVDKNNVMFTDANNVITTIEGLKLNRQGVIREFPDLKDDENWNKKAIERFKKHIQTYSTENSKLNYIMDELKKHGYIPLYKQRAGFRPQKFYGY